MHSIGRKYNLSDYELIALTLNYGQERDGPEYWKYEIRAATGIAQLLDVKHIVIEPSRFQDILMRVSGGPYAMYSDSGFGVGFLLSIATQHAMAEKANTMRQVLREIRENTLESL